MKKIKPIAYIENRCLITNLITKKELDMIVKKRIDIDNKRFPKRNEQ